MEIKKGNWYVCIKDCLKYILKDDIVEADEDNSIKGLKLRPQEFSDYFRPATPDEILIGRALTEEQQLLVKELKLKIELAKIEFMKCGLSEDEAIEQVDMVLKTAFKEVFYPKK